MKKTKLRKITRSAMTSAVIPSITRISKAARRAETTRDFMKTKKRTSTRISKVTRKAESTRDF